MHWEISTVQTHHRIRIVDHGIYRVALPSGSSPRKVSSGDAMASPKALCNNKRTHLVSIHQVDNGEITERGMSAFIACNEQGRDFAAIIHNLTGATRHVYGQRSTVFR